MRPTVRGILLATFVLAAAAPAMAQPTARPAQITLKPALVTHPEEFTSITSLRELSDGRVIATDGSEQRLVVLDFKAGTAKPIGRPGRGPEEYGRVSMVLPLTGDSSMMLDFMQRRWLLFSGSDIVETVPPDAPSVRAVGNSMVWHSDGLGRVLIVPTGEPPTGVAEVTAKDSAFAILVHRGTTRQDTVTKVREQPRRTQVAKNDKGEVTSMSIMPVGPFTSKEEVVLFQDGAIAVARLDPLRVDWRAPDGRWTRGAPLPVQPIRVDARERDAYLARNAANFKAMEEQQRQFPNMMLPKPPVASDFPEFIPPFPPGVTNVFAGPGGMLMIRRTKSADHPHFNYLVVDRTGRLVGELRLPSNEQVLGHGRGVIYIGAKDEDDILRVRRHPWTDVDLRDARSR